MFRRTTISGQHPYILNDLKHFVNTALYVAHLAYYRSQWENVRGLNTSDANGNVDVINFILCNDFSSDDL